MKAKFVHCVPVPLFLILLFPLSLHSGEAEALAKAAKELSAKQETAGNARQKTCLGHAVAAANAAQEAIAAGNEEDAVKMKKKALRWAVQAVRECAEPGEAPGQIGEALHEEGAMSSGSLARFNDLMDDLVNAKKAKEKSDNPFCQGLAINQIMLALDTLITDDWDGWYPEKAIRWYLNAAADCENVQEQIKGLIDYLNSHADTTGIVDLSNEGAAQAKKMLDELYAKKAAGASPEEIVELVEKIKAFLRDQGAATGKARRELDRKQMAEERKEQESRKTSPAPANLPITTVTFTALQGKTVVNQKVLGPVETITFTALDGKEIKHKEIDADFDDHGDHMTISTGKLATVGGIVITGIAGTVHLICSGDDSGGAVAPKSVSPADGMIEARNGVVNETLAVPDGATDILRSPQEHLAAIDGQPVSVVAVRDGEIAVAGENIRTSAIGASKLEVTSPSGGVFTGTGTSWGYDIMMPEITKTDTWVPVMAVVHGLDPQVPVTFTFLPQPGQAINPATVTVLAAELLAPTPVTRIRAEMPGPQSLAVSVTAEDVP